MITADEIFDSSTLLLLLLEPKFGRLEIRFLGPYHTTRLQLYKDNMDPGVCGGAATVTLAGASEIIHSHNRNWFSQLNCEDRQMCCLDFPPWQPRNPLQCWMSIMIGRPQLSLTDSFDRSLVVTRRLPGNWWRPAGYYSLTRHILHTTSCTVTLFMYLTF